MPAVKRATAARMSESDRALLVAAVIAALPTPAPTKSALGRFFAGYGALLLTVILAIVGYVYGLGAASDRINNIQANVSDMRQTAVTKDDLNAKLSELRMGQVDEAKAIEAMSDRLTRLESRAMNGKQ